MDPFPENILNITTIKHLIETSNININKKHGLLDKTLLHQAVCHNNIQIVKYLIDHGADLDQTDKYNSTPLHDACRNGDINTIKYLTKSNSNNYNLISLCELDNQIMMKPDTDKYTGIIRCLVESGADVNVIDKYGYTPLQYVARHDLDMVKLLLNYGADKEYLNLNNQTAAEIADDNFQDQIAEYIRSFELMPTKGVHD